MKKPVTSVLALIIIGSLVLFAQGCKDDHDHGTAAPQGTPGHDDHAARHIPKHGGVVAEFPGHRYAVEIIEDDTTSLVTAFVTDAHFEPVAVDAAEVRLNFTVEGTPKTYTLARSNPDDTPAAFTLTDAELAALICDGWQGDATASVEIGGRPNTAKLGKPSEHNHAH